MKNATGIAISLLAACVSCAAAQNPSTPTPDQDAAKTANADSGAQSQTNTADAYDYFTMGHLDEEQYEATGKSDYATQAVDLYKKALAITPDSAVIMERMAETYAKSQHIHQAVLEALEALKADPDNVSAHRLLARIYVRTLGDLNAGQVQKDSLDKAIEQFEAIQKLDPKDDNSALWLARLYRFENEHGKAEVVLRQVLQREPDNEAALEQLSQLLLDKGQAQDAVNLLSGAAEDADSPSLYDLLGNAYAQQQDNAKAEKAYRSAVELEPDDPGHRRGLAQALVAQDKYQDALEQYQRLSELEPESAENFLRMAQVYRRLGKMDQAETSLARAKQLAPGSLEVLYSEALLYENEGDFTKASQVISDAIAGIRSQAGSDPNSNANALGILYEQLGRIYTEGRNYDAALKTYDEMAQLGPQSAERAEVMKIETYRESRNTDKAVSEAKKALADSPNDRELTTTYALLLGERGSTDEAVKMLRALVSNTPEDEEIFVDLAQVQEQAHQYTDAEQWAGKALDVAQKPEEKENAWFMMGAIFEREKKFDQAEQEFRKVLNQNPNNAATLNYYGYMLADRGVRLDEATSLIKRAVEQEPVNGAYLDSLGWVYYKQGKFTEAEEYLSKAIDLDSHDPTILGHLGYVYLKLGQNQRAAETYEKALSEWQKALPGDYEPDRAAEIEQQLKTLKRRLAQKTAPEDPKPQ